MPSLRVSASAGPAGEHLWDPGGPRVSAYMLSNREKNGSDRVFPG